MQEVTNPSGNRSRRWLSYLRVGLTLFFIGVIVFSLSTDAFLDAIYQIELEYLVAAYLLNVSMILLMAYRWTVFYRIFDDISLSFSLSVYLTFIAAFFNTLLPSSLGGDTYRAVYLSRHQTADQQSRTISLVLVDRVLGLGGIALLGILGIASAVLTDQPIPINYLIVGLVICSSFSVLIGLLFIPSMHRLVLLIISRLPHKLRNIVLGPINRISNQVVLIGNHYHLILEGLALSAAMRFAWVFSGYLIGLSLDIGLPFWVYLAIMPTIEIIRMIPLTVQGIGVREGLFILVLGTLDIDPVDTTLLVLLIYNIFNLNGVVGGLLYLIQNFNLRKLSV